MFVSCKKTIDYWFSRPGVPRRCVTGTLSGLPWDAPNGPSYLFSQVLSVFPGAWISQYPKWQHPNITRFRCHLLGSHRISQDLSTTILDLVRSKIVKKRRLRGCCDPGKFGNHCSRSNDQDQLEGVVKGCAHFDWLNFLIQY